MIGDEASRVNIVLHVRKTTSARILLAVKLGWHQKFENVDSVLEERENNVYNHSSPCCEVVPKKELWWNVSLKNSLEFWRFTNTFKLINMLHIYLNIIFLIEYIVNEARVLEKLF